MGHARALLGLPDLAAQKRATAEILAQGLSVRATEKLVRRLVSKRESNVREDSRSDVHTRAAEDQLRLSLGTRVRVVRKGKGGRIEISFTSEDELHSIYEQLVSKDSSAVVPDGRKRS